MNCLTARETLDLTRRDEVLPDEVRRYDTDGKEVPGATIEEAARHVKGCQSCQTAVRRREKIDERIGQLSRDVPVPAGLQERLLTRLASEITLANENTGGSPATGKPVLRPRRRLIVSTVAACVAVASGIGVWQIFLSRPASLTMDEIAEFALSAGINPVGLPDLTQFKGGLDVLPPKTTTLRHMRSFKLLADPQLADREIAVYFFTLSGPKRGKFAGRLVVVPAAAVKDLPAASSFPGQTQYKLGYCTTAWVEGKFVYLCCVLGGERELHLLRPATAEPV